LIDTSRRDEITEAVEINLSRDEDSVTTLAAAPQVGDDESSLVVLAGINSSLAEQKKNNNQHMRSFRFEAPQKKKSLKSASSQDDAQASKKDTEAKKDKAVEEGSPGKAEALSRASIFRTKGPESGDTYQRVLRLSLWKKPADASEKNGRDTRVGAIATGMAQSGEIVFFSATAGPTESDVIGRIRLDSQEEAEDVDFASLEHDPEQTGDARGKYRVAYTNGADVMVGEISSSTRSNAAPDVSCVYTIPLPSSGARAARPKLRALRFLSSTSLLLLQNAPNRGGSELVILRLPRTKTGTATIIRRRRLPRSVQIGLGLDICPLGTNPAGQQQTIIAVSGSDNSIALWTLEFGPNKGYGAIRPFTTLRDVHPFSMTKLVFSPFTAPAHPVTPDVLPQKVKLASISMGNTVVVHTLPLSPFPATSRTPRYVLSLPGPAEFWEGLYFVLVLLFSLVLITGSMLAFTEIRGGTPPVLGAAQWLPPSWRSALVNEYTPPAPGKGSYIDYLLAPKGQNAPPVASVITQSQIESLKDILDRVHSAGAAPLDLETISPHELSVILRCHDGQTAEQSVLIETLASHRAAGDENTEAEKFRTWADLSGEDQVAWKRRLTDAGRWASSEGETVLKGVLFGEACGQLHHAVEQALP
jgi:glycyl-tRNA synthetase